MTKPNGKPCSRCGKSPKVGRYLCAECQGTCVVCGKEAGLRPNGQFRSKCKDCAFLSKRTDCVRCGKERDGSHVVYCKACFRDYSADWSQRNPDKVREKMWRHDLKRTYGITPEQWVEMLERQGGTCAICERMPGKGRRFHVDHCHRTGKVRALLCGRCNVAIGMAGEDGTRLRRMADYCEAFA